MGRGEFRLIVTVRPVVVDLSDEGVIRMKSTGLSLLFLSFGLSVLMGCAAQEKKDDVTPLRAQSMSEMRLELSMTHQAMTDSALMHDMSLADIHFVPHTSHLNLLGMRRLDRYVDLLNEYGGTLYLESVDTREESLSQRREQVVAYLDDVGVENDRITVASGVSAGSGMSATEAIEVKKQAYKPKTAETLTTLTGGGTGGAMGGTK